MPVWFDRWSAGTRGRILALLRAEPRSVSALADEVGVSDNAVRTHLTSLQRDGLVESAGTVREGGAGKPAALFRATTEGEELFPKAYATVLGEVLRVVAEREGEEGLIELLREVGRRAGAAAGGEDPRVRLLSTVALLRSLGAEVELIAEGDAWRIEGKGCPLAAVVREQGVVCTLVESLVAEGTGSDVTQHCRHGERPQCGFRTVLR